MAVLLANTELTVASRSHPYARDAHGTPAPGVLGAARGPFVAGARETSDGGTWSVRLPIEALPVAKGDALVEPGTGRSWTVLSARAVQVPGCALVDYVTVTAELDVPEVP